jgi:hypothetical protein
MSFGGWMLARQLLDPGLFFHTAAFWVLVFYLSALGLVIAQGHGIADTGELERVTLPRLPEPIRRWIWWWNAPLGRAPVREELAP